MNKKCSEIDKSVKGFPLKVIDNNFLQFII